MLLQDLKKSMLLMETLSSKNIIVTKDVSSCRRVKIFIYLKNNIKRIMIDYSIKNHLL